MPCNHKPHTTFAVEKRIDPEDFVSDMQDNTQGRLSTRPHRLNFICESSQYMHVTVDEPKSPKYT